MYNKAIKQGALDILCRTRFGSRGCDFLFRETASLRSGGGACLALTASALVFTRDQARRSSETLPRKENLRPLAGISPLAYGSTKHIFTPVGKIKDSRPFRYKMSTPANFNIKLIIGLGNPGAEYKNTYHNAGFLFINYLIENSEAPYSLLATRYLLKSNVYMNESGGFVKKALKKHGAKPEEVLIVHDDSDLTIGNFKLSFGRGSAGHKGVESIIQAIGTKNFWRLRIGVRPQSQTNADYTQNDAENSQRKSAFSRRKSAARARAGEFVLRQISKNDQKKFSEVFEKIAAEILSALTSP